MKKIVFALILILLIPAAGTVEGAGETNELPVLAALLQDNDLTIENWQVTIKEKKSRSQLQNVINLLKDRYLVTTNADENAIKYRVEDSHKVEGITEVYEVIIPNDENFDGEMIAVIKGNEWEESAVHIYREKLYHITEQYFTSRAKRFACLETEDDDIMKSEHFLDDALEYLDLKYVSTQTDKITNNMNKKFLYGYTPLWGQEIPAMENPVNLQIAVKNIEKENSKITVGTPILINEY
jgi:hypothetical protein